MEIDGIGEVEKVMGYIPPGMYSNGSDYVLLETMSGKIYLGNNGERTEIRPQDPNYGLYKSILGMQNPHKNIQC